MGHSTAGGYLLTDIRGLQYRFDGPENRSGYRMVSGISTKDGFRLRFEYASGGKAGRYHILTGENS